MSNVEKEPMIVIEGPDGAGKTSMCKTITSIIKNTYDKDCITINFPNEEGFAYYTIKNILSGKLKVPADFLQMLIMLNMKDTFKRKNIKELRTNGTVILLDRFVTSSIVYNTLENGCLLDSIYKFLNKNKEDDDKIVDLKDVYSSYLNLNEYETPDVTLYLLPHLRSLQKHAQARALKNNNEIYDDIANVNKEYSLYGNFYLSIRDKLRFNKQYYVKDTSDSQHIVLKPTTKSYSNDQLTYKEINTSLQKWINRIFRKK